MEGRYILLADYAEFSANGRLSLIGGDLERFSFPQLPATTHPFKIVAKIHLDLAEKDHEHDLQVIITDPSRNVLSDNLRGVIEAAKKPYDRRSMYAGINVLFTQAPLRLNSKGRYTVKLLVDSAKILETSFYVFVGNELGQVAKVEEPTAP